MSAGEIRALTQARTRRRTRCSIGPCADRVVEPRARLSPSRACSSSTSRRSPSLAGSRCASPALSSPSAGELRRDDGRGNRAPVSFRRCRRVGRRGRRVSRARGSRARGQPPRGVAGRPHAPDALRALTPAARRRGAGRPRSGRAAVSGLRRLLRRSSTRTGCRALEAERFFETSRGCWWGERMHCTFCGLNGATMSYRSKSPRRAVDELMTRRRAIRAARFRSSTTSSISATSRPAAGAGGAEAHSASVLRDESRT